MRNLANAKISDLLYLAFITEGGMPLFEMNFQVEGMDYGSDLVTGFVSAIQSFSKEISERQLKVIDQGDVKICLEEGKKASLIYMVSSENAQLREKMRTLLEGFELRYQATLKKAEEGVDPSAFTDFRESAMEILANELIKNYYIVNFISNRPPEKFEEDFWPVITSINGRRTVNEIAKHANMNLQSVVEILASLNSQNIVDFHIAVNAYDIPVVTPKGMSELFKLTLDQLKDALNIDKEAYQVIKAIDGKRTISDLSEYGKKDLPDLKKLIKSLLARDYVELLSEEYRFCLIMERMYNYLFHALKSTFGEQSIQIFRDSVNAEQETYAKLVKLNEKDISFESIKTYIEGQETINTLELVESLSSTFSKVLKNVETLVGSKQVNALKNQIFTKLKTTFGSENISTIEKYL